MSDIRIYVVAYHDGERPKERVIIADAKNHLLPERSYRIAVSACGKLALPTEQELQPGQQFVVSPADGSRLHDACPAYNVTAVHRVTQEWCERAANDTALLEDLLKKDS